MVELVIKNIDFGTIAEDGSSVKLGVTEMAGGSVVGTKREREHLFCRQDAMRVALTAELRAVDQVLMRMSKAV